LGKRRINLGSGDLTVKTYNSSENRFGLNLLEKCKGRGPLHPEREGAREIKGEEAVQQAQRGEAGKPPQGRVGRGSKESPGGARR